MKLYKHIPMDIKVDENIVSISP